MKFIRSLIAFVALLSVTGATSAFAGNTVVVTNSTTYTVYELYSSSSSASGWTTGSGYNLITANPLLPGQTATFTIPGGGGDDNQCLFDLMGVVYGSDQHAYQYGVDACNGGTWTIAPLA